MRTIDQVMTPRPSTIDVHACVAEADEQMRALGVHHLVVLDGARIVGTVSDHDVDHFLADKRVSTEVAQVGEVMRPDPIVVPPWEPIARVARKMADGGRGCAVIVEAGVAAGIFTGRDALELLAVTLGPPSAPRAE
jgi:CBS domain-containing protein